MPPRLVKDIIKGHLIPRGESDKAKRERLEREENAKKLSDQYRREKVEYDKELRAFLEEKKEFDSRKEKFSAWYAECSYDIKKSFRLIDQLFVKSEELDVENRALRRAISDLPSGEGTCSEDTFLLCLTCKMEKKRGSVWSGEINDFPKSLISPTKDQMENIKTIVSLHDTFLLNVENVLKNGKDFFVCDKVRSLEQFMDIKETIFSKLFGGSKYDSNWWPFIEKSSSRLFRQFARGLYSALLQNLCCGADMSNSLFVNFKKEGLVLPSVVRARQIQASDVGALIDVIRSVVVGPEINKDVMNALPKDLCHLISMPLRDVSDFLGLHHPFFLDLNQKMEFLVIIRLLIRKSLAFSEDLGKNLSVSTELSKWQDKVPAKYKAKLDAGYSKNYHYLYGLEDYPSDGVLALIVFVCNLLNHINEDSLSGGISREEVLKDICAAIPSLFTDLFEALCLMEREKSALYWQDVVDNLGHVYKRSVWENNALMEEKEREVRQEVDVFDKVCWCS